MKITIYADPGHAWAKVNKALLNKLGITDQISSYKTSKIRSYTRYYN